MEKINNLLNKVKISKSLHVLFLSIFLIPVVAISSIVVYMMYSSMIRWEKENVTNSLIQTEQIFDNTLTQIQNFSDRIFVNKQMQKVILQKYDDLQDVYSAYSDLDFFENYLHAYTEVASYRIYTENHTLLDNQFIIKTNDKILNSDWYIKAKNNKGKPFWCYKQDSLSKNYYLCLIRSLWNNGNGEFAGVLVVNLNPELIQNNLSNLIFETAIFFDNEILYSSNPSLTDKNKTVILEEIHNKSSYKRIKGKRINNERMWLAVEKYNPQIESSLNFFIMYLIPIKIIYKATSQMMIIVFIGVCLVILLSFLVIMFYANYIQSRVYKVQAGIRNVVDNNFEIPNSIGGNDEFEEIYGNLYEMSGKLKNLIQEISKQTIEKEQLAAKQSEISFKMLSTQINPHFLFNTLETIRMKSIASGDREVGTMLKLLASLLRYNLSVKGKPVPLIDEVNSIQNYLNIQHMRFGERISYDVATMCDIQKITILPLLIQPIVENSFSHGLEDRVSGGFIYILINCEIVDDGQQLLTITVKDNGCGITEEKLKELNEKINSENPESYTNSIGMVNVSSRIKLFYGKDSGIKVESEIGEGTTVTIKLYSKLEI